MTIRILCTGDIHLGRQPTRLPEGEDTGSVGPAEAFRRFGDMAIRREVHAVVLTGDVVDADNRFYEAYSVLQAEVRRLLDHGVPVLAVAGNHDHDVLARLADEMDEFRLLGRGGRWEEAVVGREKGEAFRVLGWSFPDRYVRINPLEVGFPASAREGLTVGVLHCDCSAPASSYAPVRLADLQARPVAAWLLGHVHRPMLLAESRPLVLYPGSPQGLDPGEPGAHGAWLVELEYGAAPRAEFVPLAALRYEPMEVPLDGVSDADGFNRALLDAVSARHSEIKDDLGCARWVACRVRLTGRTGLKGELPSLGQQVRERLQVTHGDARYYFERIEDAARPDHSLADLAGSNDPLGLLARRLLALEHGEPAELVQSLLRQGRESIEVQRRLPAFLASDDLGRPPDDEAVRATLLRAGYAVLDALLKQKEGMA